jgi:hypothetical protein
MNPTMKAGSLAAAQAADGANEFVEFDQNAQSMAAVARHKGETPRKDALYFPNGENATMVFSLRFHLAVSHARKLERELIAANKRIKELEEFRAIRF